MRRSLTYLVAILIVLVCVYSFWVWLQYKWSTVIKQTTASIMIELHKLDKLETAKELISQTIEGEQAITALLPNIGADALINSALFKDAMILNVSWEVSAWYVLSTITTGDIRVSRDGTVNILLWAPEIFQVTLTGVSKTTTLGIITQQDIDMENALRAKAKEMIMQQALSGTLLNKAQDNVKSMLQDVFLKAGIQIKEVIIDGTGSVVTDILDNATWTLE